MGLMLQEGGVYPQARPDEMLRLVASFYPTPDDPERLLRLVDLTGVRRTPYRRLSGGQRQRLALALALIGRPQIVFLDEPTAGLDVQARQLTWTTIRMLKEQGATVVLTTHDLHEAEALADRVGIMAAGKLVALGTLAALRADRAASVRVAATTRLSEDELRQLPHARAVHSQGAAVAVIDTDSPALLLRELTAWAVTADISIRELRVGDESLEEIFLRLTNQVAVE
jgi:ABC-2 type transport system ATP-binding protein